MSLRYKGGVISATPPTVSTTSAPGVWTLPQQFQYQGAGTWPLSVVPDPYFEYVTMLLHGDGTNGAQNNTFLDSSTSALTITRNGNTTQGTFAPFSRSNGYWSNYFDGTGDYLSVADNAAFELGTGNFTAECFVYLSNVSSGPFVFGQWESSSGSDTNSSFLIYVSASKFVGLVAYGNSTSQVSLTGTTTLTNETWYHVALVRNGTSLTLYVNGVQEATSTTIGSSTVNNSNLSVIVGGRTGGTSLVTGYISNARIVKGTAVYTSAFTPPTTPLTAITNTSLLTCQSNRFIDNSTNAFTITRNGDTSVQVFSPFNPTTAYSTTANGGSGFFDGNGDYLDTATNTGLALTGQFTVECWYYQRSVTQYATIFELSVYTDGLLFRARDDSTGGVWVNGTQVVTGGSPALSSVGRWSHFAITRNASNSLSIYLNGTRIYNATNSASINSGGGALRIGASSHSAGQFHDGYITDMRVVKGTAVYDPTQTTITIPTAPLTAITNTTFLGSFTNGGIFDNAAMNDLETAGNAQISTAQSKFGGGSMLFDGTDDYLVSPASVNYEVGTGNYTIEFWVYWNTVGNIAMLFGWNGGATGSTFAYTYSDGRIAIGINGTNEIASSSGQATTGSWIHMAFVKNGSTTTIYKNGTSIASNTTGVWSSNTGTATFSVGGGASASDTNCYIDDFRITKGYARYTANFTPPTAAFPNL